MKGDELMSVPIGDVLGIISAMTTGYISIIVVLLIELIKAQKK